MDIHINKELINKVCELDFQVDCHTIKMIDSNDENKTIIQGFGWIKIDKERTLNFRLYITDNFIAEDEKGKSVWYNFDSYKDEEGYYNFIAEGVDGRNWEFKTYSFSENLNGTISSISSSIYFISEVKIIKSFTNSCIEFILSPDIKLFYNKLESIYEKNSENKLIGLKREYHVDIEYDDLKIYGKKDDDYILIGFYSNNFHDNSDLRLIEGLQLITGFRVRPYLVYKQINEKTLLKINSIEYKNDDTFLPPLSIEEFPLKKSHYPWDIFSYYYKSVSGILKNRFSPIGSIINSLVGASGAFFETQILVLCIRTEGMLEVLFPEEGKPDENIKNQVDTLIKYISKWSGDKTIIKRATNNIGDMKSARAKDKLIFMIKKGIISEEQFNSWNKLRNASAHSKFGIKKDYDFTNVRERYNAVIEMYYRILFYYIGCKGKYTEYSTSYTKNIEMNLYKNKA